MSRKTVDHAISYEQLVQHAPEPIFWKDTAGVYLGCNQPFLAMVGASDPLDIIGKTDFDFCWHQQADCLKQHDLLVLSSQRSQALETQLDLGDGSKAYYTLSKNPLYAPKGHIIGIMGTALDITHFKRSQSQAQHALSMFKQFADMLPETVYWLDINQHYLSFNKRGFEVSGTESFEKDFAGKTPLDLFPQEMAEAIIAHHQEVIRTGKIMSFEEIVPDHITHQPKVVNASIAPLFDDNQQIIGTCGISIDITQEKRYKEELMQLTAKLKDDVHMLKQFADMLPEPFYWLDLNQYFLGANQRVLQVTGTQSFARDFAGKTPMDLYPEAMANAIIAHHQEVIRRQEVLTFEEAIRDVSTKQYKIFSATIAPLFDAQGKLVGTCSICIDITKEKQLQEDLFAAKEKAEVASQAKSQFITNMSHDIRTPITGILAMNKRTLAQVDKIKGMLAQSPPEEHSTVESELDMIYDDQGLLMVSTNELLELCNNILDVVQIESGKTIEQVERFNLRQLIQKTCYLLQSVAESKQLTLSVSIDDHIPDDFVGIRLYLERILTNLVSNALKFTSEGEVKIGVFCGADMVTAPGASCEVIISVQDTGIGIAKDKQHVIFENFSRLTPSYQGIHKGAGLGLYMVKSYVETMQGQITVDSVEGRGSDFRVTLPLTIATPVANTEPDHACTDASQDCPMPSAGAHVLIVEDHPAAALGLKSAVEKFHCTVDVAKDGQHALNMAQEVAYQMIFMDVGLPDISGIEVTRQIRHLTDKTRAAVPIIAVTGHAGNPEQRLACFAMGMQAVFDKPLSEDALQALLAAFIA